MINTGEKRGMAFKGEFLPSQQCIPPVFLESTLDSVVLSLLYDAPADDPKMR